jgi:hypothetical protein
MSWHQLKCIDPDMYSPLHYGLVTMEHLSSCKHFILGKSKFHKPLGFMVPILQKSQLFCLVQLNLDLMVFCSYLYYLLIFIVKPEPYSP